MDELAPGFVSIEQLERDSDLAFFNEMLVRELPGDEAVDAYIFLGPDVFVRKNREKELLESIGQLPEPVFFLADGRAPWKGLVGKAVSFFQGKTLRFHNPSQMADGVERLVRELDATE
jgi:DNA polymerase III delta subunit